MAWRLSVVSWATIVVEVIPAALLGGQMLHGDAVSVIGDRSSIVARAAP